MQLFQEWQVPVIRYMAYGVGLWAAALLCQCTTDDTGTACSNPNTTGVAADTVQGEEPVVEVIRIDRDPICQTFNCLTHMGLPSYCTRTCKYNKAPAKPQACSVDSDCVRPQHCNKGICNDDDCPQGFYCKTVQDVGPLSNQYYCVRRSSCTSNLDCEDVGSLACTALACFDRCNQDSNCRFHQYVCEPDSQADCGCAGGAAVCGEDAAMQCPPASQGSPRYSAVRHDICLPK